MSGTVKLLGLPYASLTHSMERTIEKTIQLELGADSMTATCEADWGRQRGRRLAPGDTVVKWDAIFLSAAAASTVRGGNPNQFEQGLTNRLRSEDNFEGVSAEGWLSGWLLSHCHACVHVR